MQLSFGERNWVIFSSDGDFFESLGYLSNNSRGIYISSETSNNRWGAELRIWIENSRGMPSSLRNADSAGLGNYERRINCNEYVYHLVNNFGFSLGTFQNSTAIRNIVATNYANHVVDFDRGYNI